LGVDWIVTKGRAGGAGLNQRGRECPEGQGVKPVSSICKTGGKWLWGLLAAFVMQASLSACSVASLVGAKSEPPSAIHDLRVGGQRARGRFDAQLMVNEPGAVDALSSSNIAIKPSSGSEISYFAASEWSDKLPRLLQLRLAQFLENSHAARAVTTGSDHLRGDYSLAWEIRDFQIEVNGTARAHARFYVKLINEERGELVASREFSAITHAANDSAEAGVDALNRAFEAAAAKILRWLVRRHVSAPDMAGMGLLR